MMTAVEPDPLRVSPRVSPLAPQRTRATISTGFITVGGTPLIV
jgi:hypothetical protein